LEDRRNVGENSCNSGDGTDQTCPILDVYDDDMNIKIVVLYFVTSRRIMGGGDVSEEYTYYLHLEMVC